MHWSKIYFILAFAVALLCRHFLSEEEDVIRQTGSELELYDFLKNSVFKQIKLISISLNERLFLMNLITATFYFNIVMT